LEGAKSSPKGKDEGRFFISIKALSFSGRGFLLLIINL